MAIEDKLPGETIDQFVRRLYVQGGYDNFEARDVWYRSGYDSKISAGVYQAGATLSAQGNVVAAARVTNAAYNDYKNAETAGVNANKALDDQLAAAAAADVAKAAQDAAAEVARKNGQTRDQKPMGFFGSIGNFIGNAAGAVESAVTSPTGLGIAAGIGGFALGATPLGAIAGKPISALFKSLTGAPKAQSLAGKPLAMATSPTRVRRSSTKRRRSTSRRSSYRRPRNISRISRSVDKRQNKQIASLRKQIATLRRRRRA